MVDMIALDGLVASNWRVLCAKQPCPLPLCPLSEHEWDVPLLSSNYLWLSQRFLSYFHTCIERVLSTNGSQRVCYTKLLYNKNIIQILFLDQKFFLKHYSGDHS